MLGDVLSYPAGKSALAPFVGGQAHHGDDRFDFADYQTMVVEHEKDERCDEGGSFIAIVESIILRDGECERSRKIGDITFSFIREQIYGSRKGGFNQPVVTNALRSAILFDLIRVYGVEHITRYPQRFDWPMILRTHLFASSRSAFLNSALTS